MANLNLKFLRGLQSALPTAGTDGYFYLTTDTHRLYTSIDGKVVPVNEGVTTVANLDALVSVTGANAGDFFYCTEENILCVFNGQTFVQINADTGATSIEVVGEGNAVTAASYDPETRKLTLTKGETFALPSDISTAIGELGNDTDGNAYANVKAYVDAKTTGIATDATVAGKVDKVDGHSLVADSEITKLVGVSEGANKVENVGGGKIKIDGAEVTVYAHPDKHAIDDIDGLSEELNSKVKSVTAGGASVTVGGSATEPTVAVKLSAAEGNALTLADDGLKVIIPESTKVEASATNGNIKVDGEEVVVYAHPANHEMSEISGLADALAGKQDVIPENTYDTYGAAATAEANAKAYVDAQDIFQNDTALVNAHGGLKAGETIKGMTTHQILEAILFPYVAFTLDSTSRSAAAATLENGATQTLSSASITITKKSKPITSVTLYNGSNVLGTKTGDEVAAGGTIKFENLGITVSKSNNPNLKFTVTDGTTSTDKNVGASTFVYPYYWGECAADATIDEDLIEGLTKKVESKGNKTVTHTMSNGRMVIAYPKAHGVLKSILDPNNFETIGDYTRSEVSVTGLDGTAQTYYVYASGAATVSGFKVQYKY